MLKFSLRNFSTKLSFEMADTIASGVVNVCKRNGFAPITVNIMNPSGNIMVRKTMDGCPPIAMPEFSYAKAYTCIALKGSSRNFRDKYTAEINPAKFCQMTTMVDITGGNMAPFPGGVLMKSSDGQVIGAVGVSGASGDEDEYCALRAIEESGF